MSALKDVLTCAADHLDRVGLHKGSLFLDGYSGPGYFVRQDTPCCAYGAVLACKPSSALGSEALDHLDNTLGALLGRESGRAHTPTWNDEPLRTKEEVVALLRRAAEVAP